MYVWGRPRFFFSPCWRLAVDGRLRGDLVFGTPAKGCRKVYADSARYHTQYPITAPPTHIARYHTQYPMPEPSDPMPWEGRPLTMGDEGAATIPMAAPAVLPAPAAPPAAD